MVNKKFTVMLATSVVAIIGIAWLAKYEHDKNSNTSTVSPEKMIESADVSNAAVYIKAYDDLVWLVQNAAVLREYFTADDVVVRDENGTVSIYLTGTDRTGYAQKEVKYAEVGADEEGDDFSEFMEYLNNK